MDFNFSLELFYQNFISGVYTHLNQWVDIDAKVDTLKCLREDIREKILPPWVRAPGSSSYRFMGHFATTNML